MTGTDIVVIFVVLAIIGGAIAYIIREKKRGKKCIGCPYSEGCGGRCGCDTKSK
ncbi:MAG: FeoB-associated Cys-rich membrane protein [Clostridia bacterium]|nr:FeoB-associated Cys-rich membrane protein [Clostridia bacterium]MBO7250960.1 FeoB-associated Cys-rich membrane protein [Clostridia bacterium]